MIRALSSSHPLTLFQVESRVIIDTYGWNRFNPNRQVNLGALDTSICATPESDQETDYGDEEYNSECDSDGAVGDGVASANSRNKYIRIAALTTDQLLLCSATLRGYSLKNKKWRKSILFRRSIGPNL